MLWGDRVTTLGQTLGNNTPRELQKSDCNTEE